MLDTVRADHLSLLGYPRDTSPCLTRLARRRITFTQARSTAPWTLPSHASMLTGRWPHELSTGINAPLDSTFPTLAECLAANGYATAGFVANATYCGRETGLDRGFNHYEDHQLTLADILWTSAIGRRLLLQGPLGPERRTGGNPNDYHRKTAGEVREDFLSWTMGQKGRPFFAFLNLYDAHDPYIAPPGFDPRFSELRRSAAGTALLERWFIHDKKTLHPDQLQFVIDAYDDGIAYLDDQVGKLMDDLDRLGLLENTLVIVTADHGEHLGEHQLYGHASSLYDAEVHVPLVLLLPGAKAGGRRITAPVSLRDLAATVAELTGLEASPLPGRSLTRYWRGDAAVTAELSLCEVDAPVASAPNQGRSPVFRGPMKALASDCYVYIRGGGGHEELFDVVADPGQQSDLSGRPQEQRNLIRLRSALEHLLESRHRPGNEPFRGVPTLRSGLRHTQ